MALVVDASVGLKWVLAEPDSHRAKALLRLEPELRCPDFWLSEATNVLWREVRRRSLTPSQALAGVALLASQVQPTSTVHLDLHEVALALGMTVNQSPYDTIYVAFALRIGASAVVASDRQFVKNMQTHPDPVVSAIMLPLDEWARSRGVA